MGDRSVILGRALSLSVMAASSFALLQHFTSMAAVSSQTCTLLAGTDCPSAL